MLRYKQQKLILPSTEVIEFDNLFLGRLVVICKDAAVGVFSFPQVEFAVYPLLSLNHKTVCLPFPFLDENGGQLKLNTAQFHFLPTSEGKDVIVERTASVGTDIEGLAVFSNLFHYLFRTRAAISSETVDNKLVLFKPFKEPLQRVLLVETDLMLMDYQYLWAVTESEAVEKGLTKEYYKRVKKEITDTNEAIKRGVMKGANVKRIPDFQASQENK